MEIVYRLEEELRSDNELIEHYELEKILAKRLMNSNKVERKVLYSSLYDELFKKLPSHPQLTRKESTGESRQYVNDQLQFLNRFLEDDSNYLEVGPGDCSLSYAVSEKVKYVYAIDVSSEIAKTNQTPENFKLLISDGSSIPVPAGSIDLAYSNQLMEHLHPDDAVEQLNNILRSLVANGKYICITPNRLSGPHDISMYFDDIATGFHLKEYTNRELIRLFKDAGFSKVETYIGGKGLYIKMPPFLMTSLESFISFLPKKLGKVIARAGRGILQNCQIVGIK